MAEHSEEEEEKSFKELGVCDQLVEACHNLGWKTASKIQAELVGGIDKVRQSILLANRPNILVATPGRLLDHLSDTEGFSLRGLKFLVLDEADKLLNADFEKALDKLLGYISPRERTYLFSATMSKKEKRLGALNKFTDGECNILICTDVLSRRLDIPYVDMVINYDIPTNSKDYIHRVGRTARAGRYGVAISLLNQYDLLWYKQIEEHLENKRNGRLQEEKRG